MNLYDRSIELQLELVELLKKNFQYSFLAENFNTTKNGLWKIQYHTSASESTFGGRIIFKSSKKHDSDWFLELGNMEMPSTMCDINYTIPICHVASSLVMTILLNLNYSDCNKNQMWHSLLFRSKISRKKYSWQITHCSL